MIRAGSFRIVTSLRGVKRIAPVAADNGIMMHAAHNVLQTTDMPTTLQIRTLSTNNEEEQKESAILYEGPFASLTLRLKRVSLTSAVIGIIGLPGLSFFYGAADSVPATGQIAVIATAGLTAVGSTVLLGYCFSPYVHTLERVATATDDEGEKDEVDNEQQLIRMVTRDILAREVVTVFNPQTDVTAPSSSNSRPFCNFMVNGLPFYIHPQLIEDDKLRNQLVQDEVDDNSGTKSKTKSDDDEFL